jgi:hypothetical protein
VTGIDELRRRAYARDSTPEQRTVAEAELARRMPAPLGTEFTLPPLRTRAMPRLLLVALLGAVAGLGLVATVSATFVPPALALEVFDRPAIDADAAAPAWVAPDAVDARWLTDEASWSLFAYRTASGEVCVAAVKLSTNTGRSCTLQESFVRAGLKLTVYAREPGRVDRLTVVWHPDGSLDVEVAEVEQPNADHPGQ